MDGCFRISTWFGEHVDGEFVRLPASSDATFRRVSRRASTTSIAMSGRLVFMESVPLRGRNQLVYLLFEKRKFSRTGR